MSIVINKTQYNVPGLVTMSWLDSISWIKYITDKNPRTRQIRSIVAHTHEGIPSDLVQGAGRNSTIDESLARYQTHTDRSVSWDYTIDLNGDVVCQNDPLVDYSWQGNNLNPVSLGFELVQDKNPNDPKRRVLYSEQIAKAVLLIDFLTAACGIQRQIPWNKKDNKPNLKQIKRLSSSHENGTNLVGIIGHVNVTDQRGYGDPGFQLFYALRDAGYELFDMDANEDITTWKQRQKTICGFEDKDADGIPLKNTVNALKAKGYKNGMLVSRPLDQLISFG
jgi:hypothetical protein